MLFGVILFVILLMKLIQVMMIFLSFICYYCFWMEEMSGSCRDQGEIGNGYYYYYYGKIKLNFVKNRVFYLCRCLMNKDWFSF